ncbi:thyrotropin-releasing hormone receptor, partial [Biomphalaria glabrata]
ERRFSIQMPALIKRKRYNQNITVTTIVACVIFSLLVTPRPLYYFVEMKWDEVKQKSYSRLLEQIFFAMSDSCHAVNFYIYFLSNRLFRRRLLELAKKAFMYISDFLQVKCHGLTRQNTLGSVMEVWTIEQGTYTRRNSQQQETYTRRNSQQQGTYTRRNSQQQGTYTRRNSQQQGTYTRRNSQQQGTYTRRNSQL